MFHSSHHPWFDHPNDIWWRVHVIKFLSPASYHFPPPIGPNILLSTLSANTLNLCSSLSMRDQVPHPYKTTGKIMCFVNFNL
jgi:hypothetical protein